MSNKNSSITNYLLPPINKYRLSEEIGSGAYGVVYKGFREDDGRNVALKRIYITDKDGNNNIPLSTHRELCALKKLNAYENENIVRLFDVVLNKIEGKMCMDLIFELGDYDLEKYLRKYNSNGDMPLTKIINLSKQLLDAIHFMHSYCVIHRDLKPANILINKEGTDLKITDFGLARILGFDASLTPVVVTLWYRSPEILLQQSYLTACDIWSAGCIIAEMVYGRPIFPGENEISQIEKIVMRLGLEAIDNWPDDNIIDTAALVRFIDEARNLDCVMKRVGRDFRNLVKELLRFDPTARMLSTEGLVELDKIAKRYCSNCSASTTSGYICNGRDCDIDTQIVHSVVRNVLDDDFSPNKAVLVDSNVPGSNPPIELIDITDQDSSDYSQASSCSETESCDETGTHQPTGQAHKDSDEVGDSFSSYRSQNNCSFSSYAPSSLTGADTTDDEDDHDDHHDRPVDPTSITSNNNKELAELAEFQDSFSISEESGDTTEAVLSEVTTMPVVVVHDSHDDSDEEEPFVLLPILQRNNSTPFKEINDTSRLQSPSLNVPKDHLMRKRILSSEDSASESENGMLNFSPISAMSDSKPSLMRQKSLRRRVSMVGPHVPPGLDKPKSSLVRTGSVMITPICENDDGHDISFGERSLSRALDSIKSLPTVPDSQLSDRPKIVCRRRSTMKKLK